MHVTVALCVTIIIMCLVFYIRPFLDAVYSALHDDGVITVSSIHPLLVAV